MIGLGLSIYEEGIEDGIELNLFLLVCKKLAKGNTALEIAEALEESEDVVQELCEKAMVYAPEFDEKKIREDSHSLFMCFAKHNIINTCKKYYFKVYYL